MKQVILEEKKEQIHLEDVDFSKPIGFLDNNLSKGYFVYAGKRDGSNKPYMHAISLVGGFSDVPNASYGSSDSNWYQKPETHLKGCPSYIGQMFVFDTLKELHKWLAED